MNGHTTAAISLFLAAITWMIGMERRGRWFWLFTIPFVAGIWMIALAIQDRYAARPNVRLGIHMVGLVARAAKR